MKKERNARKNLINLYSYFDNLYLSSMGELPCNKKTELVELEKKYNKHYANRYRYVYEWPEYYGLFKINGRYCIDPKRMNKYGLINNQMYCVMSKRNTTYFHPKKEHKYDYFVNCFIDKINYIKESFIKKYKPIIDKSIEEIKKIKLSPGDYFNFQCGISSVGAAQAWANYQNFLNADRIRYEKYELYTSLYAQFFHNMVAQIEAISVNMYSKLNPDLESWNRCLMYKGIDTDSLSSFKFHNRLYLIWNFLKHNNSDTYNKLKSKYPKVLIENEYISGNLAVNYVKLDEKLIIELLEGLKRFFIDWCRIICNEDYNEALWNYEDYFISVVNNRIEEYHNPLGLEWWDDID